MTVFYNPLKRPNKREGLIYPVRHSFTGVDSLRITGGFYQGIYPQTFSLVQGQIKLICSADVANRQIHLTTHSATNFGEEEDNKSGNLFAHSVIGSGNVTASQTFRWNIGPIGTLTGAALEVVNTNYMQVAPEGLLLCGNSALSIAVITGQAADVVHVILEFKYLGDSSEHKQ